MTAKAWGMSEAAFEAQELNDHGKQLLRHMGEHIVHDTRALGDPCSRSVLLLADETERDYQSAHSFAEGFYPPDCVKAGIAGIVRANATNGLLPTTSDNAPAAGCGTGPDEAGARMLFGGSTSALTDLYRPQLRRIGALIGCCSPALCAAYGRTGGGRCALDELPYTYDGEYWRGLYAGPLSAGAVFAQAWMLQALSGLEYARGELAPQELANIFKVHMRMSTRKRCTHALRASAHREHAPCACAVRMRRVHSAACPRYRCLARGRDPEPAGAARTPKRSPSAAARARPERDATTVLVGTSPRELRPTRRSRRAIRVARRSCRACRSCLAQLFARAAHLRTSFAGAL